MAPNSIIDAQLTSKQFQYNIGVNSFGDILTLNDKVCFVSYQDRVGYAVFQCENKGYILKEKKLYLMTDKAYIHLLLKMDTIERQCDLEKPSIIKNVLM